MPGRFFGLFFYRCYFSHKKNSDVISLIANEVSNYFPPPKVNHELTCCQNYEGYEVGEVDQYKDQGGVYIEVKGQTDGGEDKADNNQEDK